MKSSEDHEQSLQLRNGGKTEELSVIVQPWRIFKSWANYQIKREI